MAITISSQSQLLDNQILIDSAVTADAQNNVRLSEATSYLFKIDNLNVASSAAYFKIWDHTNPIVGTTEPDYVLMIPATTSKTIIVTPGITFTEGLSYACTLLAVVSSVANPSHTVSLKMVVA